MADTGGAQQAFVLGHVNPTAVMSLFRKADKNGSGRMDFDEFAMCWKLLQLEPNTKEVVIEHFEKWDSDNNGFIDIEEFESFLESIDQSKHTDGKIDFHWGYETHNGPLTWKDHFPAALGCEQSPIDIKIGEVGEANPDAAKVTVHYQNAPAICLNNGHTVVWTVEDAGHIMIGEKQYDLCQFHFHCPSEHTIDGEQFPICFHFVHSAADGELAVLGFLFKMAERSHEFLDNICSNAPVKKMDSSHVQEVRFSALDFLDTDYINYPGSLTTPPCSEKVIWFVCPTIHDISNSQRAWFRQCIAFDNAREVQPMNGRTCCYYHIAQGQDFCKSAN